MKSTVAILTEINQPLGLREIDWIPPSYGQVLCEVIVSGICGAQISEIRGDKNPRAPLPRLMGHEAAVRALQAGPGVKHVKNGDLCVAHWRSGTGVESDFPMWMEGNGGYIAKFNSAGRITTFSTHSVISENRLTAVPSDTPVELIALLGCSLSTALGTIEHEAKLLMGESVLIIGCGGLGLNLILAAKLRLAGQIIAVDTAKEKEQMALQMGAHHFGHYATGVDVVIDTTGSPQAIEMGLECLGPSGRFIMVGQPKPRENVTLTNARHMFDGDGKTIIATQGGGFSPSKDIPRYIEAHRAGRIDLTGIVTHRMPLAKINEGLDLVRNGQAGRVLINCAE